MKFTYASGSRPLPGYTIKRGIGIGGFGEVYFAFSDAGKEVALKKIQRNLDVELRGVTQCLNIRHANLISLFDIRTCDREESWVVMEYVPGRSLHDIIGEFPRGLPQRELKRWFTSIVSGVAYLHQRGIVHRDLKPGNIFHDDDIHAVKIGDYGLAKFISAGDSGHTDAVGTVHYMAPEIGNGVYGREIDIYALGIVLYELLTGDVPFDGESAQEILLKHLTATPDMSQIPAEYRPTIEGALVKDPESRFSSVSELVATLPWPAVAASADRIATLHIVGDYATPSTSVDLQPRENFGATSITSLVPGGAYVRPILVTEDRSGLHSEMSASAEFGAGVVDKVDRTTTPPIDKEIEAPLQDTNPPSIAEPVKLPRRTTVRIAKQDMPIANMESQSSSPTDRTVNLTPTKKLIQSAIGLRNRFNQFRFATLLKVGLLSLAVGVLFNAAIWGPVVLLGLSVVSLACGIGLPRSEAIEQVTGDQLHHAGKLAGDDAFTAVRSMLVCGIVAAAFALLTFISPQSNLAEPLARWVVTLWSVSTAVAVGWTVLLLNRLFRQKLIAGESSETWYRIAHWSAGVVAGLVAVIFDGYFHQSEPLSETFLPFLLTGTDHLFLSRWAALFLVILIWFSVTQWTCLTHPQRDSTVSLTLTLLFLAGGALMACVAGFSPSIIGVMSLGVLVGVQIASPCLRCAEQQLPSATGRIG